MPSTSTKRTWSASEVAERIGLTTRTITRHIREGKLNALQPGRKYVIRRDALVDYLGSEEQVDGLFGSPEQNELDD